MLKVVNYTDRGEIFIYGNIISDTDASWLKMLDDGTLGYQYPTKIKEQLDELKGKPILVHLASDGGDVAAGIAIANMLSNHDAPVTVYIDSWAASIASVIAFAGNKIIMPENTFLMIHNPRAGAFGEADYLQSVAEWLRKIRDMVAETYAKFAPDWQAEDIKSKMDAETWFTAAEAADFFRGKVEVVPANELEAVASLKSSFKAAPEAVNKVAFDKAEAEKAEALKIQDENLRKEILSIVTGGLQNHEC